MILKNETSTACVLLHVRKCVRCTVQFLFSCVQGRRQSHVTHRAIIPPSRASTVVCSAVVLAPPLLPLSFRSPCVSSKRRRRRACTVRRDIRIARRVSAPTTSCDVRGFVSSEFFFRKYTLSIQVGPYHLVTLSYSLN